MGQDCSHSKCEGKCETCCYCGTSLNVSWETGDQVETREAFMCATDFTWELGEALGGSRLYPSMADLIENHTCAKECGIVKVRVEVIEVVEKGKR